MSTKKQIGRIPISKGKYVAGQTYNRLNQVTLYGSTYQSMVDGNTSAPAILDENGNVQHANTDQWLVIADGSEAYNAGEKLSCFSLQDSEEHLALETDADGKILSSTNADGSHYSHNMHSETIDSKQEKEEGKGLIDEIVASSFSAKEDSEGRLQMITDKDGKILSFRDKNGMLHETEMSVDKLQIEDPSFLVSYLKKNGYTMNSIDWSAETSLIRLPQKPNKAIVNFTNITTMPQSKTANLHAYMEFWDLYGNYFRKKVIFNAQGNSSMGFVKKNFAVDICNDDWIGEDTCKVKIGDWVAQDSFHIKAYYADAFRGIAIVGYSLFEQAYKTRGVLNDRPYKKYYPEAKSLSNGVGELDDNGYIFGDEARCFPDGFPCVVFHNGEFYGVYSFQLKKHRDNMKMDKKTAGHIHLDGQIDTQLWNANGDFSTNNVWNPMSHFEIRNPKNLICMDGSAYNPDTAGTQEPIDETSEAYDSKNKYHVMTAKVKKSIIELSKYSKELEDLETSLSASESKIPSMKAEIEKHFDVNNIIDYICVSNFISNMDGFWKNWQWATWDGVKWSVLPYDLDCIFGGVVSGSWCYPGCDNYGAPPKQVANLMATGKAWGPLYWIYRYYISEIKLRWTELRKNVLTTDNVVKLLTDWCSKVGVDDYNLEFKRWKDCPCHRDNDINTEYYEQVSNVEANKYSSVEFDADTLYKKGQYVDCEGGYLRFKVLKDCQGIIPYTKLGHYDSIYRVKKWVEERISYMDDAFSKH